MVTNPTNAITSMAMNPASFPKAILVNIDTLCPPFVVETATLLDVNGNQSDHCHHQHGDEPGKLSQSDGETDKTHE